MLQPYIDIVLRSTAVYIFMLVAIRLSGKKELSQLNMIDVVLILLISNAVQNAMVGPDSSLSGGLAAAAALFLLNFLLKKALYRSKRLRELVFDKPQVLVHNGHLDFKLLSHLDITSEELEEAMREHGVGHFSEVKLAMLETDGHISILSGAQQLKQSYHPRKAQKKHL